jgi:DNA-binding transcriptional MocR family regulator
VIHSVAVKYDTVDMTLWSPRLDDSPKPIYARIADAVERDVRGGVLLAGSRLPTHRSLASDLGITPVTVTRAYAEAARRGLVESSSGRGTFVRAVRRDAALGGEIDLGTNAVAGEIPPPSRALLERAAEQLIRTPYGTIAGSERHRAAGAAWIGRKTDPARVLLTSGAQHALFTAFLATARAGETILVEALTYHGARAIASQLNVRLEPVAMDRYGLLPDALERQARARSGRVLYVTPSLQNPTATVMPETRRREVAAVAEKHGLTIIEDDVYGFLLEKTPAPVAAFAPERTIFITGLGKALAPSFRVGFAAVPDALLPRFQSILGAIVLFTSPFVVEIAASWIEDGTAERIAAAKRAEVAVRQRMARAILPAVTGDARSSHVWLPLKKQWTADAFAEEARKRGVRVVPASSFAAADTIPPGVRISLGAPASAAELESALQGLAGIGERTETQVV